MRIIIVGILYHQNSIIVTDEAFERELAETLPADDEELKQLEYEYNGSYPRLIGQIMHVQCFTRADMSYSLVSGNTLKVHRSAK